MSATGPAADGTSVTEIAKFDVKQGTESEFVTAYRTARHEIATAPGCRAVRMSRGVESPSSFVLIVEWDSLEAHTVGFRGSEGFGRWRAAIGPFFAGTPSVEHVVSIETPVDATAGSV
jgi:heme-degrading monooxygenase HmoA